MTASPTTENPREAAAQPPFPQERLDYPGLESAMTPRPDYGEESYQGHGRLQGRVALITGGGNGIGRAGGLADAAEGADVLISYLNEDSDAEETARVVREAGQKAVIAPGDISEEAHCRSLVERTVSELGKLDILVNNAAWPHLQPGTTIINTASIQAYQPSPTLLPYASTKGAIVTFSKALAQEGAEKGIRVNVVAPGPIWTPLIPATMPEEKAQKFGQDSPLGRPAQPAELAPLFVFLASNESSYITGEVVGVTGGKPLA